MTAEISPYIEHSIRRAHPKGELEFLSLDHEQVADSSEFIDLIIDKLLEVDDLKVEVAELESEGDRAITIRLSRLDFYSWAEFNRTMDSQQRVEALLERSSPVFFWTVLVSRLGRFWTGIWNRMVVTNNGVIPVQVDEPSDYLWNKIVSDVQQTLIGLGGEEVSSSLLWTPVPWMNSLAASSQEEEGARTVPTVYACLFDDVL